MNQLSDMRLLAEDTDDSWLDKRVKNPLTGNEVFVRSLPLDMREKYRPKKGVGDYETQKSRIKMLAAKHKLGDFSLRKNGKSVDLIDKESGQRLPLPNIGGMADSELIDIMKGKHGKQEKGREVSKEEPDETPEKTPEKEEPKEKEHKSKKKDTGSEQPSSGQLNPAKLRAPPQSKFKTRKEFAASVQNVKASKVTPIPHGINPSFFIKAEDGSDLVFKVADAKTDSYKQSVRFNGIMDDLGWGYLSPGLQMGSLDGTVSVSKKKKDAQGHFIIDKSAPTKDVKNPTGIFGEFVAGSTVSRAPTSNPKEVERIMKVKPEDVVRAALIDGLTSSRDRHPGNLLIGNEGELYLIDNTQMFASKFKPNSVFTGLRQKELPEREELKHLDYHTHVEGGKIGTNYPPEFKKLLGKISSSSAEDLQKEHNFERLDQAEDLKKHAANMLTLGFEKACKLE